MRLNSFNICSQGHDTTACAAVWFLYCMGTHPEHQVNRIFLPFDGDETSILTESNNISRNWLERSWMMCLEIQIVLALPKTQPNSSISNVASKKHYVCIPVFPTSSDTTAKTSCWVMDTKSRPVLLILSTSMHFIATKKCLRILLHSIRNDFKSIKAQVDIRLLSFLSALDQGTALVGTIVTLRDYLIE